MLLLGRLANAMVRPVPARLCMSDEQVQALDARTHAAAAIDGGRSGIGKGGLDAKSGLVWLAVAVPIGWGVWITLSKALILFR